ncbi:hypothetical protein NAT51_13625 [Flavobacterium amniphilum]|uniref:hypothetical protein n=1 Tax=Flavobacterium amniphilum TaxID=1834035 RepID=UPI00202A6238|nr:hypothetical protein [Flavobacterium amniphilum]MCL9806570.1 hypothetical protein [Flavobacterium amniphilum]
MKNKIFVFLFFWLTTGSLFAQNIAQIDSLTVEMCKSLSMATDKNNKEKIEFVFQKHIPEYFEKIQVSTQTEADSISDRVFFRLQKNCNYFSDLLETLEENKSDWKVLDTKPSSKITQKDYKDFSRGGSYYYKEHNGTIVNVEIKGKKWSETFHDGTFSKLTLIHKENGEFDLKFIESNNGTRKNLSVKDDIYQYGIYEKTGDVYLIWAKTADNRLYGFKLYKK